MANMEAAPIRKMVLVLEVGDVPRLYCESFLNATQEPLVELALEPEHVVAADVTTQLNEVFVTKVPVAAARGDGA